MLYGGDNGCFGAIKTDLYNKMIYGIDIYPRTKDKTVVLLNNYHVSRESKTTITAK